MTHDQIFEGLHVVFQFPDEQPRFGDVFEIVGSIHPNFPPSGKFRFGELEDLQFSQVDDYFGVRTMSEIGEDICIWLYPLVDEEVVHHHPGPLYGN